MKSTGNNRTAYYAERIARLSAFMTEERYATLCRAAEARTLYMTVLAENIYHDQNAAALMRHCEAFGLQQMHTVETVCPFDPNPMITRGTEQWIDLQQMHTVETVCPFDPNPMITRGTEQWIDLQRHASTAEALASLRREGYRIVATTPHRGDCTPERFDVARGPFALVFGTEHAGISEEVIAGADEFLRIPMCGMVESLNVSASAAILLYQLSERMRRSVTGWQIDEAARTELLHRWMCRSVKDSEQILERFER